MQGLDLSRTRFHLHCI